MIRRYMDTNRSLDNSGNMLPLVLWNPKKAGSNLDVFEFFPSLKNSNKVVYAKNYINSDSFQLIDYYLSYGEDVIDFEVIDNSNSKTTIRLKYDINFEGVFIYKVNFIDGSRSFFLGIGGDGYEAYLADMGYYNISICDPEYYSPIAIVVD